MTSTTQVLRNSTHDRHAALERVPLARDLMSPQLTVRRYIEILCTWSSAWAALEQRIHASPLALKLGTLLPPRRAQLAQSDLLYWQQQGYGAALAFSPSHEQIDALRPASLGGLLGVCYVARGASLGSKLIAAHLGKVLALSPEQGMAFFAHDSAESLTWPQWSRGLDAQLAEPDALAQAVVWANATFFALQDAFASAPSEEMAGAA